MVKSYLACTKIVFDYSSDDMLFVAKFDLTAIENSHHFDFCLKNSDAI